MEHSSARASCSSTTPAALTRSSSSEQALALLPGTLAQRPAALGRQHSGVDTYQRNQEANTPALDVRPG